MAVTIRSTFPSQPRVEAPFPRPVRREEQEDETEQHGGLTVVLEGPEPLGLVELKVGDRHFS